MLQLLKPVLSLLETRINFTFRRSTLCTLRWAKPRLQNLPAPDIMDLTLPDLETNGHKTKKQHLTLKQDLLHLKETTIRRNEIRKIPLYFLNLGKKQNKLVYPMFQHNNCETQTTHPLLVTKIQFHSHWDVSRPELLSIYKIMPSVTQYQQLMF